MFNFGMVNVKKKITKHLTLKSSIYVTTWTGREYYR